MLKEELEQQVDAFLKMKVVEIEKAKSIALQLQNKEDIDPGWSEKFFDMIIQERTRLFWEEHLKIMEKLAKTRNVTDEIQELSIREYMNFLKNNVAFFPFGSEDYKKIMELKSKYDKYFQSLENSYKAIEENQMKLDKNIEDLKNIFNTIDNLEELEEAKNTVLDGHKDPELEDILLTVLEKRKQEILKNK